MFKFMLSSFKANLIQFNPDINIFTKFFGVKVNFEKGVRNLQTSRHKTIKVVCTKFNLANNIFQRFMSVNVIFESSTGAIIKYRPIPTKFGNILQVEINL